MTTPDPLATLQRQIARVVAFDVRTRGTACTPVALDANGVTLWSGQSTIKPMALNIARTLALRFRKASRA